MILVYCPITPSYLYQLKCFYLKGLSFFVNWTSLRLVEFKNPCEGGDSVVKIINLRKLWHVIFSAKFTYNIAALYLIVFVCYLIFGFASPHRTPQLHVCSIRSPPSVFESRAQLHLWLLLFSNTLISWSLRRCQVPKICRFALNSTL